VWSHEEEEFASSIADLIALATEAEQHRRAEETLRQSEQRLRLAQQLAGVGTWEWDLRTNKDLWSASLYELFGLSPTDGSIRYDDFLQAIHPQDRQRVEAAVHACLENGTAYEIEHRIVRPDGTVRWVAERGNIVRDAAGTPIRMLGVTMDISARRQAEDDVAAEKERLAVTLRSIGDAVITTDVDGRIVLMNRAAEDLTGWTSAEAQTRLLADVVHLLDERTRAAHTDIVARVISAGAVVTSDTPCVLVTHDGCERLVRDSAAPIYDHDNRSIGVVVVLREVTAARRMGEELLKAQKLESISILAGGIAHDFNNLLTIMLGNISLARMSSDNSAVVSDRLADAENAIEQAMHLTRQLLAFSRGSSPTTQHTSISQLLHDTVPLLVRGTAVRCELNAPEALWPAEIDAGQISQVINNLVINAVQAMPKGGDLRVTAENTNVHDVLAPHMSPGAYVRIAISDTGSGIAADALARIFDPYFTTKPKGNGLGLTISYSIVKNHKGAITVDSTAGQGTTFNIYLPAAVPNTVAAPAPSAAQPVVRGRILLMDDEQIILRTTRAVLQKLGFAVETTTTGEEAVQAYTAVFDTPAAFDAVILDMTVPGGMGGMDTLRALAQLDPSVRAVATSGYFNDDLMADLSTVGFKAMLRKPYTVAQLQETIRNVMEQ
jgi:PAS domain S-box-containing protein